MAPSEDRSAQPGAAWFDRAFDRQYLASYAHRNNREAEEQWSSAAQWLQLSETSSVLDLACGAGRHLGAMRRAAPALTLVGLDRSRDLLDAARAAMSPAEQDQTIEALALRDANAPQRPPTCHWVRSDMRWLPFPDASFDAVTQWFTAFGYFDDRSEDQAVLQQVQRILRPGARHLLDTLDPDHVRATLVPESERSVAGGRLLERRSLEGDRVIKRIRFVPSDAKLSEESWHESVRLWEAEELEELYAKVGLKVRHCFGHIDGQARSARTRRLVFIAEKPAEGCA